MTLLTYGLLLILAAGLSTIVVNEKIKHIPFLILSGLGNGCLIVYAVLTLVNHSTERYEIMLGYPFGAVQFIIGGIGSFFIIVIALMTWLSSLFGGGYLLQYIGKKKQLATHYVFIALLNVSMIGVIVTCHTLSFLVIWEIMSLSSFFLIMFESEKPGVFNAGMQYLILMHIGVLFLIVAFITASTSAGSMSFEAIQFYYTQHPFPFSLFILFLAGFGMKAGIVPLHIWLPEAHSAAPTHISAIMSGVMIKTGIFGIIRVLTIFIDKPTYEMAYTLIAIGLLSALYGILSSTAEKDMKRILAFSTIENAGIIITGIGLALLGYVINNPAISLTAFAGTMLHIFNHAVFKGLLFYGTGAVYSATHERNIERLGGLIKRMPQTGVLFFIGIIAICALPPLNGFVSEFMLYMGMLHGIQSGDLAVTIVSGLTLTLIAFTGAIALISFSRLFGIAFLGSSRSQLPETVSDPNLLMRISMYCGVVLIVALAFIPHILFGNFINKQLFGDVLKSIANLAFPFLLFGIIAVAAFLFHYMLLKKQPPRAYKVWDCGYQKSSPRLQYTGYSYNSFFASIFRSVFRTREEQTPVKELFPQQASLKTERIDLVNELYERGFMQYLRQLLRKSACLQTGYLQHYILYGLIFLLAGILWSLGA